MGFQLFLGLVRFNMVNLWDSFRSFIFSLVIVCYDDDFDFDNDQEDDDVFFVKC